MENPIKMDDLGVPLFLETPICTLPETNKAPENLMVGRLLFLLGAKGLFSGAFAVSFREGIYYVSTCHAMLKLIISSFFFIEVLGSLGKCRNMLLMGIAWLKIYTSWDL